MTLSNAIIGPTRRPPLQVVSTVKPARSTRSDELLAKLPDRLAELMQSGRIDRQPCFQDDRFNGMRERWSPPATLTPEDAGMARDAIHTLDQGALAPADPSHVLGRILALLSHYPARTQTPEVEQMIALDWAEDLGEFPAWTIDQAARQWRRSQKWRPSIAEIRVLCEEIVAPERSLRERLVTLVRAAESTGQSRQPARLAEMRRLAAGALQRMNSIG